MSILKKCVGTRTRKIMAGMGAAVGAFVLAIGAYAFFAGSASSGGMQSAGAAQNDAGPGVVTLAVAPNGLSGNPLVPGGSAQTVYFKVTNPGSSPVLAPVLDKELAQSGASLYGYSGCLASWYQLGTPMFYQGLNGDGSIPANSTAYGRVLVSMPASNVDQSLCENAKPSVNVSVSGSIQQGADSSVLGPYQTTGDLDSADSGGNWATDTFTRTYTVAKQSDGSYNVTEHFLGTFETLPGNSPESAAIQIPAGIKGQMDGEYVFANVHGTFDPNAKCLPSGTDGKNQYDECNTTAFFKAHFSIDNAMATLPYGWGFRYSSDSSADTWNNGDATHGGNTGNITR